MWSWLRRALQGAGITGCIPGEGKQAQPPTLPLDEDSYAAGGSNRGVPVPSAQHTPDAYCATPIATREGRSVPAAAPAAAPPPPAAAATPVGVHSQAAWGDASPAAVTGGAGRQLQPALAPSTNSSSGGSRLREATPPLQVIPGAGDQRQQQQGRYIVSDGKPVGIANTVSKYKENQPLVPHLTPFEERVARKLCEEQHVAAAVAAAAAASRAGGEAHTSTPPYTGCGSGVQIKQKLFV